MAYGSNPETTTRRTEQMQTYYDNVFLETVKENLVISNWADIKKIPLSRGKTINFYRWFPLSITTTAITEGSATQGQQDFKGQTLQATVAKYASYNKFSELLQITARDPKLKSLAQMHGAAAAEEIDLLLLTECVKNGSFPIRQDELVKTGTYTFESTVDDSTGLSSTVFVDAVLAGNEGNADNYFNEGHFAVKGNTNYGHGSTVASYTSVGNILTLDNAAPVAYDSTTTYRIVQTTGLTSTDIIDGTSIGYAVSRARELKFYPFPGGFFRCPLGSHAEYDLQKDSVYRGIAEYQKADLAEKGFIKALWGVQFYRTTKPYLRSIGATATYADYNESGNMYCTPIMGMHALARVDLAGYSGPKIIVKTPGPQTISEPHDENSIVGRKFYMAAKALNSVFAINLLHGATGI